MAGVVAASTLPARELGGKTTTVDITLAVTVTIALSAAEAATVLWGNRHRRRADRLDRRNKELSRDVKELQRRLREHGLSDDVSR